MRRIAIVAVAAALCAPWSAAAHEVPDRVNIAVFAKPEGDRLRILVRMPANALIDFLLPTLPGSSYVNLREADAVALSGGNVWIADLLRFYEDDVPVPRPDVRAIRIARATDPSFRSFQDALGRIQGARLSPEALVTQEQVAVDALLEAPIRSAASRLSFEPRFARLGVVVETRVTFVTPSGDLRRFLYQGDVDRFELDPDALHAVRRFVGAGVRQYFGDTDNLLLAACIVLAFSVFSTLAPYAVALVCVQSLALLLSLAFVPEWVWLRGTAGVLMAAAIVYIGAEAIVGGATGWMGMAAGAGLISGCGFWSVLQPLIQFSGTHPLGGTLGFAVGVITAEIATLASFGAVVHVSQALSRAPRMIVIIAAAAAVHIAWRRLLDRADALTLTPQIEQWMQPVALALMATAALALAVAAYRRRHVPAVRGGGT